MRGPYLQREYENANNCLHSKMDLPFGNHSMCVQNYRSSIIMTAIHYFVTIIEHVESQRGKDTC